MMSNDCLFNNSVPVFLKYGPVYPPSSHPGSHFGVPVTLQTENGRRTDNVIFELLYTTTTTGRRNLELRVNDSNDPFFMWQCVLSEDEFYILKRDQNLLVDYNNFPYKVAEFLQQCSAHAHEAHPLFMATLNVDEGGKNSLLTITESTTFKQINHLSLRLTPVNEQLLRKHLSDIVRNYKDEINSLRSQLPMRNNNNFPDLHPQRQPSQPFVMPTTSLEERVRILESQNVQLSNQKMAAENELNDLKKRYMSLQDEMQRLRGAPYAPPPFPGTSPSDPLNTEINKANEIIRKLQDEVKSLRSRARSAEASLRQLEKVSKDSQSSSDSIRQELQQVRDQLTEKSRLLIESNGDRERLQAEVEETRRLVEANEKVIEWLHQQINEDSINRIANPIKYGGIDFTRRLSPDTLFGKSRMPEPTSGSSTDQY